MIIKGVALLFFKALESLDSVALMFFSSVWGLGSRRRF